MSARELRGAGREVPGCVRFMPDGTRLALEILDSPNSDICVYDLQRDAMTRLTFGG